MKEHNSSIRNGEPASRLSSVANAMLLLKSFSETDSALGIGALAARLGLAKSTVHRLAGTLVQAGMLEQTKNGKYQLGITIFELGSLVRNKIDFYSEAKDALRNLREKTGESANLAILRGESVIYLNSLESSSTIKVTAPLGKRVPAHACVEGRALLAFSEPNMLESVIRAGLAAPPPQAIIDLESLRAELALIRERGYALGNEEATIGVRAIAAPFFGSDNDVVGAIGIAGPTTRLSRRNLRLFLPMLNDSVEALSSRLGAHRVAATPARSLRLVRS